MGPNKIRVNRNRANRGQCYEVMVPQEAKNHAIPKIRVIARPMLCSNGSTRSQKSRYSENPRYYIILVPLWTLRLFKITVIRATYKVLAVRHFFSVILLMSLLKL